MPGWVSLSPRLLVDFALAEPHFVEINAYGNAEIILFYKWIWVGTAAFPFKTEVHCGFERRYRESKTGSYAMFFESVGISVGAENL